jgi:HAD superfamily hydrolase (TIGR01459 family)
MSDGVLIDGLRAVAGRHEVVLCDVWGVIHNGRKVFASACDALVQYRAQGGRVALVTNAPVPRAQVERHFAPLGVPQEAYDTLVSSGDTTRALLSLRQGQRMLALGVDEGWERDRMLYAGLDLAETKDATRADFILAMGLRDGYAENPEDYREELAGLRALGLPMVVPNPDIQVRVGDRLHWCGGALGRIYGELGGEVILAGKPHRPIYDEALRQLGAGAIAPDRVLAIGDGPATDIRGANAQGYGALYVGTGLHTHQAGDFAASAAVVLAREGVSAHYIMPELAW